MSGKDMNNGRAEIPDWKCERFLLGELDETEMEEMRRAVASDEQLRERLEAIEQSNREILRKHPPRRMAAQIREKLERDERAASAARRRRGFQPARRALVPAALLAVILLAVIMVPQLMPPGDQTTPEGVRLKGPAAQLHLYRKTASGSEQLKDEDRAAEHDLILLQYQIAEPCYGAILSVDGRGTITRHFPDSGGLAVEMEAGDPRSLDYAYELDDAPGWEFFVLVTASRPFQIDSVTHAIEESLRRPRTEAHLEPPRSLELPEGCRVTTFTLIKDSPHEN